MLTRFQGFFLPLILMLGLSCQAMDFSKAAASTAVILVLLPSAFGITVTDEWTYNTTNAQTILGAISLVLTFTNFISGWYFYKKTQDRYAKVLSANIDELERNNELGAIDNDSDDLVNRVVEFIERIKVSAPDGLDDTDASDPVDDNVDN